MDLQNIEPLQYPNLYGKRQPKQPSGIQSKRCVGRERAAQRARLHAQAFCPPFLPSLPPLLTCITHTYLLYTLRAVLGDVSNIVRANQVRCYSL